MARHFAPHARRPEKRHEYLLQAHEQLLHRYPSCRIDLDLGAGEGGRARTQPQHPGAGRRGHADGTSADITAATLCGSSANSSRRAAA